MWTRSFKFGGSYLAVSVTLLFDVMDLCICFDCSLWLLVGITKKIHHVFIGWSISFGT